MIRDSYYDNSRDDIPEYTVIETRYQVASKDHVCDMCKRLIARGTKYKRSLIIYEGAPTVLKEHIVPCWNND